MLRVKARFIPLTGVAVDIVSVEVELSKGLSVVDAVKLWLEVSDDAKVSVLLPGTVELSVVAAVDEISVPEKVEPELSVEKAEELWVAVSDDASVSVLLPEIVEL
jgi:hypothetical protein